MFTFVKKKKNKGIFIKNRYFLGWKNKKISSPLIVRIKN